VTGYGYRVISQIGAAMVGNCHDLFAAVWVADHDFLRDHGGIRSASNGSQRPLQFSGRKA
jgi:hypothetical protein